MSSMRFTVEGLRDAMKYMVQSEGFDRVLGKMKLLSANPGKVVCELKVEEEHTNRGGTLHGGLTATLVDVVSTIALLYTERALPGVSVDMNITAFCFPAGNVGLELSTDTVMTRKFLEMKTCTYD
ncbi:acyl-coenzyme A thioesterase 13 isoform X2 [Meleagris gallopavo]|uniref:acyl-coenzyme A thioesterase 13 isoform X2 n=1 Tax=Meleagris gallopavo TaxID=9103 RepID=UPI000549D624|nr:acyl-coenzyme A thioesterase 13 isoform X2 [Meleagris gallopavo]